MKSNSIYEVVNEKTEKTKNRQDNESNDYADRNADNPPTNSVNPTRSITLVLATMLYHGITFGKISFSKRVI